MSTFVAQRITRAHTIQLPGTLEKVFPLFEPLGEKLWAEGWDPTMLYPSSGLTQAGAVFTTQHPDTKIWTTIVYEKAQAHATYFNVLPHSHTSWINVRCERSGAQESQAHITYTLTALTPLGNDYLATFTQEYYQGYIDSWQSSISRYLLHGQTPSH
ncbi:hypothetical protein EPA93_05315 [Ktedonosporobacter rubrisoli]|uniref:SRPBCC family protein n=1 Tax=Ktedonosporobacter rubrisoli TaxID=2509675 RepID=A0A4P6JKF4_KTERU|nr:hypothetical protein [Ktedonosporobacter rubrisoli]QBD75452.1 hypothetical protein EPA93_05315 [Ktedonosporobacter rubrisoli]